MRDIAFDKFTSSVQGRIATTAQWSHPSGLLVHSGSLKGWRARICEEVQALVDWLCPLDQVFVLKFWVGGVGLALSLVKGSVGIWLLNLGSGGGVRAESNIVEHNNVLVEKSSGLLVCAWRPGWWP
jgi:hypothetical protein